MTEKKEYIEREAVFRALCDHEFQTFLPLDEVNDVIDDIPAADVVEVVRCKDCRYAKQVIYRGEPIDWSYKCTYLKPNTNMFDIDYCRYGKPKEADNG